MVLVYRREGGLCVGCGKKAGRQPINFHHIFPKQKWPELIDDPRNVCLVCSQCHVNHETAARRLPLRRVRDIARRLIKNARMSDYLRRTYR